MKSAERRWHNMPFQRRSFCSTWLCWHRRLKQRSVIRTLKWLKLQKIWGLWNRRCQNNFKFWENQ
jgi:hypothetical protein